jgi:hypothetical protein
VGGLPVKATEPVPPYMNTWLALTVPVPLVENCVALSPRMYTIAALLLDDPMHGVCTAGGVQLDDSAPDVFAVLKLIVPPFEMVTLSSNTTLPPENVMVTPLFTTKPLLPLVHLT